MSGKSRKAFAKKVGNSREKVGKKSPKKPQKKSGKSR